MRCDDTPFSRVLEVKILVEKLSGCIREKDRALIWSGMVSIRAFPSVGLIFYGPTLIVHLLLLTRSMGYRHEPLV
jgi:hypothetical protein